jgi:hypothetical protein
VKKSAILSAVAFLGLSLSSALAEPLIAKDDLSAFNAKGPMEAWSFKDGVLTGQNVPDKKGSNLWTNASYKDFTLEGEFKFSGEIDSGIFLRTECDQIQIGVSRSLKRDMTGSPYISKTAKYPAEADVKDVLKPGEWNTFRITAKGAHYLVTLNGKQVLDYTSETSIPEGPIGFQVHPGVEMKVEFRKLDVKPEAPAAAK